MKYPIITRDWLTAQGACSEGRAWFLAQKETRLDKVVAALLKGSHLDWANWTIVRFMTHKQKVQYAVYVAKQVIKIYEKQYPEDNRPRLAIEAAEKFIKDPSEDNKNAAYAAARAARAAYAAARAYAADSAAYAAARAAYAAACAYAAADNAADAARAAYAAACAYAAADNAADAACAAREKLRRKIITYGLRLVGGAK